MRTTLTIDPPIAERIRKRMEEHEETLKSVVNEALRAGLRVLEESETGARSTPARFKVEPHRFELRPGIDPDRVSRFADELEDEESLARFRAR